MFKRSHPPKTFFAALGTYERNHETAAKLRVVPAVQETPYGPQIGVAIFKEQKVFWVITETEALRLANEIADAVEAWAAINAQHDHDGRWSA